MGASGQAQDRCLACHQGKSLIRVQRAEGRYQHRKAQPHGNQSVGNRESDATEHAAPTITYRNGRTSSRNKCISANLGKSAKVKITV